MKTLTKTILRSDDLNCPSCVNNIESNSEHPLAQAILNQVDEGAELPEPDYFESHTGFGVEAGYNSDQILVGNPEFIQCKNIHIPHQAEKMINELSDSGRTVALVAFK